MYSRIVVLSLFLIRTSGNTNKTGVFPLCKFWDTIPPYPAIWTGKLVRPTKTCYIPRLRAYIKKMILHKWRTWNNSLVILFLFFLEIILWKFILLYIEKNPEPLQNKCLSGFFMSTDVSAGPYMITSRSYAFHWHHFLTFHPQAINFYPACKERGCLFF